MYQFGKSYTVNLEEERVYLFVPYDYKEEAKKEGARWDSVKKEWYVFESEPDLEKLLKKYSPKNFIATNYGRTIIMIENY